MSCYLNIAIFFNIVTYISIAKYLEIVKYILESIKLNMKERNSVSLTILLYVSVI